MRALQLQCLGLVVRRPVCPSGCGILVSWAETESTAPELAGWFLTIGSPGKLPAASFEVKFTFLCHTHLLHSNFQTLSTCFILIVLFFQLYLEIILNLQKSCQKSTENSYILLFFLKLLKIFNSYYICFQYIQEIEGNIMHNYLATFCCPKEP